ncbi:Bug family tripartite tricarboxylate transporter substrate binding protein [Falsiroseomonas sp. E2-1-a20]|uniref:Bug family tripartite tricarboxylate transporter substrate binding protein n=1 Tax=Falsiroseomonas sp. E2-1-a20 TaxID=3239300 RepID=UPI003F379536
MRSTTRRGLLAATGTMVAAAPFMARAQAGYPSRNLSLISPAAPGSQTDIFSRILAAPLGQRLGRTVVVENRPGAGGIVGTLATVRAAPDGHTILYASNSGFLISPHLRRPPPYNTPRDLEPIAITLSGPSVIVVNQNVAATTVEDFVSELRANPGKYNLGSHGVGAFSHVAMEMFMGQTRTEMVHLPYNGGGPLGAAFLAGDVHVALLDVLTARPLISSGRGRVLATVGERRSPIFPDAPLVSETVAPGLAMDFWLGLLAPAGTPTEIIERLHKEITEITRSDEIRGRAAEVSMLTEPLSLPALRAKVEREWEEWGRVIRDRNIGIT